MKSKPKFKPLLSLLLILISPVSLCSCKNHFKHPENNWKFVSSLSDNSAKAYVDLNQVYFKDDKVTIWTKLEFSSLKNINTTTAKRIDTNIQYDCQLQNSRVLAYQIYDSNKKLIDSHWVTKPETKLVDPNSIDYDLMEFACNERNISQYGQLQK
jgi:hypothetical protein